PGFVVIQRAFELPARMRPAGQVRDLLFLCVFFVDGVSVTLEVALEVPQYGQRRTASPGRAVIEQYRPVQRGMVYPIVSLMGGAFIIAVQHFYRGFINL